MPTYSFRCARCDRIVDQFVPLGEYVRAPPTFVCCGDAMQRHFGSAPALGMVSERHYDGLRATDGTDIGTRAKHREYMRRNNLTTVDDYADTWKRAGQERAATLEGADPQRAQDIARAIERLGG